MQFRDHPGVQGKRDAYPFDPRLLKIDEGFNVRNLDAPDERADLDDLKESIRANGVRVPLEVRLVDEDVFVLAGHRRHKAVMELIAEGEEIKTVPVMPEPKFATEGDRILNLIVSNSGKPLKPLEVAEVVRRLVAFGWDNHQIAKRIGWKSAASVTQHLELLAMPEPVKERVHAGDISATQANKLLKNLPKGTDPAEAAKMIAANKEENKRLGVGKKTNHKVTAKTLKRDAKPKAPEPVKEEAKAEPPETMTKADLTTQLRDQGYHIFEDPKPSEPPATFSPLSDATPPPAAPTRTEPRTFPPEAFQPPSLASSINADLFGIVAKLATEAQDQLVGDRDDNDTFPVPAWLGKRALALNAKLIGDESEHPRDDGAHVDPDGEPGT